MDIILKIVNDNNPPLCKKLMNNWGLSIYIEYGAQKILFDTDSDPNVLKNNMLILGIDPSKIELVFISHDHYDHTGGLRYILDTSDATIYAPENLRYEKVNIIRDNIFKISNKITAIRLHSFIPELSLVLSYDFGSILLVGCSHPGIENILKFVYEHVSDKIFLVIGGMHLFGASNNRLRKIAKLVKDLKINYFSSIHCSGNKARSFFREVLKDQFIDVRTGSIISINQGELKIEDYTC